MPRLVLDMSRLISDDEAMSRVAQEKYQMVFSLRATCLMMFRPNGQFPVGSAATQQVTKHGTFRPCWSNNTTDRDLYAMGNWVSLD
jgi:hypothetical protein